MPRESPYSIPLSIVLNLEDWKGFGFNYFGVIIHYVQLFAVLVLCFCVEASTLPVNELSLPPS